MGYDTFDELKRVTEMNNVIVEYFNGFKARNSYVAKCNLLIALTFGKDKPKDGGTSDTWNKSIE